MNKSYYIKDHLGSTRSVIYPDGDIKEAYDYYPYGPVMPGRSYISGSDKAQVKFTGKERDEETNLDYFGARYYSAALGRWFVVDLLTDKYAALSPYVYVANNPLSTIDPNGKELKMVGESDSSEVASILQYVSGLSEEEFNARYSVKDGVVTLDLTGIESQLLENEGLNLLNNLIKSSELYRLEYRNVTEAESKIGVGGIKNKSHTYRNEALERFKTKRETTNGAYILVPKNVEFISGNKIIDQGDVMFHELAESYFRTDNKMYYEDSAGWEKGAHPQAIVLQFYWKVVQGF